LLGTLYPLAIDALGLGKISVGPPYFEAVFVPLMLPVLVLMAVGPFVAWKRGNARRLWQDLRWALLGSVLLAGALALVARSTVGVALGVLLAVWIGLATLWQV